MNNEISRGFALDLKCPIAACSYKLFDQSNVDTRSISIAKVTDVHDWSIFAVCEIDGSDRVIKSPVFVRKLPVIKFAFYLARRFCDNIS